MTQTAKPAEKIGYASVSGHDQKADLETQAQRLRDTDAMRSSRALRILICVNGVLKHVNTPDSYLRERCANIVDSVRSLA